MGSCIAVHGPVKPLLREMSTKILHEILNGRVAYQYFKDQLLILGDVFTVPICRSLHKN
jgi:hypothetical protein